MNLNEVLDAPTVFVGSLIFTGIALWVFLKIEQPAVFGLAALPISLATGLVYWHNELPGGVAVATVILTFLLFVAGMRASERIDQWFHYGAMLVAHAGMLVAWMAAQLWPVLIGQVEVPVWLLLGLILALMFGFAAWRSERVRGWVPRFHRDPAPEPTT